MSMPVKPQDEIKSASSETLTFFLGLASSAPPFISTSAPAWTPLVSSASLFFFLVCSRQSAQCKRSGGGSTTSTRQPELDATSKEAISAS